VIRPHWPVCIIEEEEEKQKEQEDDEPGDQGGGGKNGIPPFQFRYIYFSTPILITNIFHTSC
jgi:hypothetical protein